MTSPSDPGWFGRSLRTFHERHERLQRFVHEGMRVPLPRWGRFLMGCVYFTIPVVGGMSVMNWSIGKAHAAIGESGERLPQKYAHRQGLVGDAIVTPDGETKKVGAGGWGGGVHLAVSDEETQRRNRQALNHFFASQKKQQRRQKQHPEDEGDASSEVEASSTPSNAL